MQYDELIPNRKRLMMPDNLESWDDWIRIGEAAARQVDASHFPRPYAQTRAFL